MISHSVIWFSFEDLASNQRRLRVITEENQLQKDRSVDIAGVSHWRMRDESECAAGAR